MRFFFIQRGASFHPAHPIQTLSTGGERGRRLGAWLTAWPTVNGTTDASSSPLVRGLASRAE
jgi:hypothetical protein